MNLDLAIFLILTSSIFGAFSTLLFKTGAAFKINLKNKKLIGAFFLAGISFLFYLSALKQAPLTFVYVAGSISYIWSTILARAVLKEKINKFKLAGICLIIGGVIFVNI